MPMLCLDEFSELLFTSSEPLYTIE